MLTKHKNYIASHPFVYSCSTKEMDVVLQDIMNNLVKHS